MGIVEPAARKALRSQPTRDRILNAARRLFAERGFERTTIRAVASAAAINPAMVMRYYGNKEELFAIAASIELRIPDLTAVPLERRGEALVTHFLERWEGPNAGDELPVLLRAAATHESARERIIAIIADQAAPLIGAALPADAREERIGLIVVQMSGLAMSRYVLRHPTVVALSREAIIRNIGSVVQQYLTFAPS